MRYGGSATSRQSVQSAKRDLQRFLRRLDTVPLDILIEEADILYKEIIAEVPYQTGKLERSVKVTVAKDKRRPGLNASASAFASNGYNYAGIQHEEASFVHSKQGAKYHYISDPFKRSTERIKAKVAARLRVEE